MTSFLRPILVLMIMVLASSAAPNTPALPPRSKLHVYLLMGQSNMAGRGAVTPEDQTPHPRVLMLNSAGVWVPAVEPVSEERGAGVGPGLAFGKAMADADTNIVIGLVPCAVGATLLERWSPGGDLFTNAVRRAALAQQTGTLQGVLWLQGENDSIQETNALTYAQRLDRMIGGFRKAVGQRRLPWAASEIGWFLYDRKDPTKTPYAREINAALAGLPRRVKHTACFSAEGLTHKGDEVHFDTRSQHELGRRFAASMRQLKAEK